MFLALLLAAGAFAGEVKNPTVKDSLMKPSAPPAAASAKTSSAAPGFLDENIRPSHYDLKLTVEPEKETFEGTVAIRTEIQNPVERITLHSQDLDIRAAKVNGKAVEAGAVRLDPKHGRLTVSVKQPVSGRTELWFEFAGKLNKQMEGLYLSKAVVNGKEEKYAFTQFEPTHARKMFPLFDEPKFKATFDFTVTAPEHLQIISNMDAVEETKKGGMATKRFATSPKMSSYLLALAVARLSSKSITVGKTRLTNWALPHQTDQLDFGLEWAKRSLLWGEKYYGVKYPLPKMDQIVVPDFKSGAMENWGAITYRDTALLVKPGFTSLPEEIRVADVVSHEWQHQWFGNLVTMRNWDGLWLNEAFATVQSYVHVDEDEPGYFMWHEFEQSKQAPLVLDSLKNTRAINAEAKSDAEIEAMFDALTYQKGGAVLRMLQEYLKPEVFMKGIQLYMKRHAYGNTVGDDLWAALEEASGQPVKKMAKDWIYQSGYPIVGMRPGSKDNRTLILSQRRFSAYGAKAAGDTLWAVPVVISYQVEGEKRRREHRVVLDRREMKVELPSTGEVVWAYANASETGFYRVELDGKLLEALKKSAKDLNALERIGVLSHAFALARNGDGRIEDFLDFVAAFKDDSTPAVLEELAKYLTVLHDRMIDEKDRPSFEKLVQDVFGPHWNKLGWQAKKGENRQDMQTRAAVLEALGMMAAPPSLVSEAGAKMKAYMADPSTVDAGIARETLRVAARNGQADHESYKAGMAKAATPQQRDRFMSGLTQFKDADSHRKMLELTLAEDAEGRDVIRAQDAWRPLVFLIQNPYSQKAAWAFVKKNWAELREKMGDRNMDRIISPISSFWDESLQKEAKTFFADPKNRIESAERTLGQATESMELGLRFKKAQKKALSGWLDENYPAKGGKK